MAVTINASTTAGLVQTADTSGVLALMNKINKDKTWQAR
jgi:hypothetical protein